jgi:hypothetical protein
MNARKVALISTLIAVCIGSNYVLVGVPNVKLMDFIVFVGGYCLGPLTGVVLGALTWVVYGTINPYGFVPQIWLATMLSESIYGAVGGILGKRFASQRFDGQHARFSVFFGITGCFITFAYDSIVNIVYALVFSIPIIAALVLGTPFQIIHVLSNTIIFAGGSIPFIRIVNKLLGRTKFGVSPK